MLVPVLRPCPPPNLHVGLVGKITKFFIHTNIEIKYIYVYVYICSIYDMETFVQNHQAEKPFTIWAAVDVSVVDAECSWWEICVS